MKDIFLTLKKRLLFRVGSFCAHSELLFSLYSRRPNLKDRVVTTSTDICIEGFQRSGNSYLFMCLSHSNPNISIAHHIHGIAHIKRALELDVPCIVLIRKPEDTIASLLTWDDRLGLDMALSANIRYMRMLRKLVSPKLLIMDFESLIADIDKVITEINVKFDLTLNSMQLSSVKLAALMKERQKRYKQESSAPFPSKLKSKINSKHRQKVLNHPQFTLASALYNEILTVRNK